MLVSDAKEFGEALRRRRKELGYTQGYISEFTGFSISFLSDLENGKPTAELGRALTVANILGLNLDMKER